MSSSIHLFRVHCECQHAFLFKPFIKRNKMCLRGGCMLGGCMLIWILRLERKMFSPYFFFVSLHFSVSVDSGVAVHMHEHS